MGWGFALPLARSVLPDAVDMKTNTAVGLLLAACALFILCDRPSLPLQRFAQALALAVAALGLVTLGQYVFGWQLGIDALLFRDTAVAHDALRGRMSPYSSVAFALIGAGLAISPRPALRPLMRLAATTVLAIGAVALLGYLWNASELVTDRWLPPMAVNSAIAFLLLGGAMFRAGQTQEPKRGPGRSAGRDSIETKVLASFVGALLLLFVASGYTYRTAAGFAKSARWVSHTQQVRAELHQLDAATSRAETAQRDYLLTGEVARKETYRRLVAGVHEYERTLSRLVSDSPAQMQNLVVLRPIIAQLINALELQVSAYEREGMSGALAAMARDDATPAILTIGSLVERMEDLERVLLSKREAELARTREHALIALLLLLAVATGITITSFHGIRREIGGRAQAEQALRAGEEYNRAIVDGSPDCLKLLTLDGRLLGMAAKGRQLMDVDDFRVIENTDWVSLWKGEGAMAARRAVETAAAGNSDKFQGSCPTFKETPKWWDVIVTPILGPDGKPERLLAVSRDITESKTAADQVRDSAARLQAILDTVPDGLLTIDERGNVETLNPAAERIFGWPAAEVIGRNIKMLMPEPDRSRHDAYLERYRATGEKHIIGIGREVLGRRKDGSTFPIELAVSEMKLSGERHFTGTVRDISQRKEAEDQLNRFFGLSLDMLCISSADGYFKRVSSAFTYTLGWSTEEILARPFLDFVHPDDQSATIREVERQVKAGESVLQFENRYLHKDGSWRVLSWRSVPQEGGLMFATARDITASKEAERTVIEARIEAEQANAAKDTFLATMSHEIRTPLNGLLGMLELLAFSPLDAEQRATLEIARDSGRGLVRIIDDVLDHAKITAGKLEIRLEPVSFARLLSRVLNTYHAVASSNGLALRQVVDPRISPWLLADPLRVMQILNNLVSNALKFTAEGYVEVRAELLGRADGADRVCLSVKDTGIGIAPEAQQRLFQPFEQAAGATTRLYGGTGLGLSISRRLAEMMGGTIEVKSAPGEGTTMSLTLTLSISDPPQPEPGSEEAPAVTRDLADAAPGEGPLVLAVDDHPTNRELLARQIAMLGLRVQTATDGRKALALWQAGGFALIVTDCHMPHMDGQALSRAIREIEAKEGRPRTPIIAWTANVLPGAAALCHAAGMDDILTKPAELAVLKQMLAKWMPSAAAVAASPSGPVDAGSGSTQATSAGFTGLDRIATTATERAEIARDFMAQTRSDVAALGAALTEQDLQGAVQIAHRMKGSSRMVGAQDLAEACEAMEHAARQGTPQETAGAKAAIARALKDLEAHLDEGAGRNTEHK